MDHGDRSLHLVRNLAQIIDVGSLYIARNLIRGDGEDSCVLLRSFLSAGTSIYRYHVAIAAALTRRNRSTFPACTTLGAFERRTRMTADRALPDVG